MVSPMAPPPSYPGEALPLNPPLGLFPLQACVCVGSCLLQIK
jgi:hypothetical protein